MSSDPILDGLNHAQREAVTSSAPVLQVLAPPGSGKTKTLTARVAYLLSHHGYQPQDVICCTFTIKASREMRERLSKLIGEQLQARLILGTFHSICRRYLVKYGYLIGLRKGFGIADSDDSRAILRRIIKRMHSSMDLRAAQGRISKHKAHGLTPKNLAERAKAEELELVDIYRAYDEALAAANLLDYDDLLLRCGDLLREHPECVSNVQTVLVDEFQDTNIIQYDLMNLFASKHRRITIVGDPDQSIYGFRSAEIQNLRRMQKRYSNTSVVLLESNYRSSASILNSAQDVIEQDTTRPAKKLEATHTYGTLPVLRKLPNPNAEALWMVLEIKRSIALTGGLLRMSDFAVLLRSASLSTRIETAFGRAGIPYKMVGGRKFFDRTEVKTLLNYLRVVSHTDHSEALLGIINVPPRRIGDETEIEGVEQQQSHSGEEALSRFLANVALATEAQTQDEGKDGTGSVTISTIHAAKGLEWPVVFIPAVYNGSIPHSRAEVVDEERRLLYVAMTRAQALLYLSLPLKQPRIGEGEDGSTTLTPFLPPKLVKTRFRMKGPQFHEKVVFAIADILHRPRPSPEDMCKDIASLPSLLDDQWTSEGEEVHKDNDEWTGKQDQNGSLQEPYPKRRRPDSDGSMTITCMTANNYAKGNSSNFTVATTMSSGGFTSARNYIAVNPAAGQDTARPSVTPSAMTVAGPSGKANTPGTLSRKDSLTQASISKFFAGPGPVPQKSESAPAIRPPAQPVLGKPSTSHASSRSGASFVPPSLASHRLQPRPLHLSRPVLEPVQPNNYTWMTTASRPETMKFARGFPSPAQREEYSGSGTGGMQQERSTSGVRSTTFYTTTMDQVRQQASSATGRRTLGIRRSMNGWEERMKREKNGSSGHHVR